VTDAPAPGDPKWRSYYQAVSGGPPRDTTLAALDAWHGEHGAAPGFAVDLACGEGRDTAEFLRRGWRVLAVDSEPAAIDWLTSRDDLPATGTLETLCAPMQDADWKPGVDIVNASFALPFCPPAQFPDLWRRIAGSLRPGGRFAGQIFGPDDDWAPRPGDQSGLTVFDRAGVDGLLAGFAVERCEEINRDGRDAHGNSKHWHIFHIVARRD
jgi:SAM-dependent methyltransferase